MEIVYSLAQFTPLIDPIQGRYERVVGVLGGGDYHMVFVSRQNWKFDAKN